MPTQTSLAYGRHVEDEAIRWSLMSPLLGFFAAGKNGQQVTDTSEIDRQFRYHRRNIITVITLCYGLGYVCRLALNVVKKPLMDAGVFTPEEVGLVGSMLLYGYALGNSATASWPITPM